jgi:outer membrane protease
MKHIIALLFLSVLPSLYAEGFNYSIETSLGIKGGKTQEYVIKDDKVLSRLDWADKIIPTLNVSGSLGFHSIFLKAKLVSALPVKSGIMEDYDFMNQGDEPSHYSNHDSYLDKDFNFAIEAGYIFKINEWRLIPGLGFSYFNKKWTAQDGYIKYGDDPRQDVTGIGISYEQSAYFPYISFTVGRTIKEHFGVFLEAEIIPYIRAKTMDTHFARSAWFYDTMQGGFGFETNLSAYYSRDGRTVFFMSLGYDAIKNVKGSISHGTTGVDGGTVNTNIDYNSKMENSFWNVSLGIMFKKE